MKAKKIALHNSTRHFVGLSVFAANLSGYRDYGARMDNVAVVIGS